MAVTIAEYATKAAKLKKELTEKDSHPIGFMIPEEIEEDEEFEEDF